MPFTLIHMGPGVAFKAIGGRHFSLMVFGFSQVAMDIEPLVRMIRGDLVIHGVSHTYIGAPVIALVSLVIGRPVCQWLSHAWNLSPRSGVLAGLNAPNVIPWSAAGAGALVGTYSHVALDSIMHADMRPWFPFTRNNGMSSLLSVESLHTLCVALGAAGLGVLALLFWLKKSGITGRRTG
ncbi:MAG: DUF4184 family protein [Pseudomonadota bacterium]|nr:DUF4184 family protein [Pseudomonadota bacterium]